MADRRPPLWVRALATVIPRLPAGRYWAIHQLRHGFSFAQRFGQAFVGIKPVVDGGAGVADILEIDMPCV